MFMIVLNYISPTLTNDFSVATDVKILQGINCGLIGVMIRLSYDGKIAFISIGFKLMIDFSIINNQLVGY